MQQNLLITADGSHTIAVPELNATYHSKHGAIQESRHIFIDAGLTEVMNSFADISILEMGFGTGLNALLSLIAAEQQQLHLYYETIEAHPLDPAIVARLNYIELLQADKYSQAFQMLHGERDALLRVSNNFLFRKKIQTLETVVFDRQFHLVYYDAFAPSAQPELWTAAIFDKIYKTMHAGAVLLTYCSKSVVRRALMDAGFEVNKIPGPPGKREIVRAIKP